VSATTAKEMPTPTPAPTVDATYQPIPPVVVVGSRSRRPRDPSDDGRGSASAARFAVG
jgi:hypothetical protein